MPDTEGSLLPIHPLGLLLKAVGQADTVRVGILGMVGGWKEKRNLLSLKLEG